MAIAKRKTIVSFVSDFEILPLYSIGALTEGAVKLRRQASFAKGLKRALAAVGLALLLLSAAL